MELAYDNVDKTKSTGQVESPINTIAITDNLPSALNASPADHNEETAEELFGCPTIVGSDGKVYLQGHISNDEPSNVQTARDAGSSPVVPIKNLNSVPQITRGVESLQDLQELGSGIATGLSASAQDTLDYLSRPNAINDSLLSTARTAGGATNYYTAQPDRILPDLQIATQQIEQTLVNTLGHPLTPEETGELAGKFMAVFIPVGEARALTSREIEALGGAQKLEAMSATELGQSGIKRLPDNLNDLTETHKNVELIRRSVHDRIITYTFNLGNAHGWNKGVWFKKALGFEPFDSEHMRLLKEQIHFDQTAIDFQKNTDWGTRWVQRGTITGPNGKTVSGIRFIWQQDKQSGLIRLINLLPPK